jgi:hypothetical protein
VSFILAVSPRVVILADRMLGERQMFSDLGKSQGINHTRIDKNLALAENV